MIFSNKTLSPLRSSQNSVRVNLSGETRSRTKDSQSRMLQSDSVSSDSPMGNMSSSSSSRSPSRAMGAKRLGLQTSTKSAWADFFVPKNMMFLASILLTADAARDSRPKSQPEKLVVDGETSEWQADLIGDYEWISDKHWKKTGRTWTQEQLNNRHKKNDRRDEIHIQRDKYHGWTFQVHRYGHFGCYANYDDDNERLQAEVHYGTRWQDFPPTEGWSDMRLGGCPCRIKVSPKQEGFVRSSPPEVKIQPEEEDEKQSNFRREGERLSESERRADQIVNLEQRISTLEAQLKKHPKYAKAFSEITDELERLRTLKDELV